MLKYEKLNETTAWKGKVLTIKEKKMKNNETGEIFDKEIAESPPVVHALTLTIDNKVVCIKEFRTSAECDVIGFPAGKINEGETPEEAITREIEEETGKKVVELKPIARNAHTSMGISNEVGYYFMALVKDFEDEKDRKHFPDKGEKIEVMEIKAHEFGSRLYHAMNNGHPIGLKTTFLWTMYLLENMKTLIACEDENEEENI